MADKTQAALIQEQGEHAKTKRRIPCTKNKCEDQKKCPWGHKNVVKTPLKDIKCQYFNPISGKGCRNGKDCRFMHERNAPIVQINGEEEETNSQEEVPPPPPQNPNKRKRTSSSKSSVSSIKTPKPVPVLENNNTFQDNSQKKNSEKTNENQNSQMEIDEEPIQVIGGTSATPDSQKNNDYRECEAYQRKLREQRNQSVFHDVRLSPRNNTPSPQYTSPHIEPPTIKVSAPKNDDTKTPVSEQQGPTVTIPIATLAEWSKKMNEATQNINSPSGTRPSPTSTTTRPGLATSYPADPEDDGGRAKSEGGGNGNPDQTAKATTGKGVSIQILNKMIVEEILEDIISDFNNFNYD